MSPLARRHLARIVLSCLMGGFVVVATSSCKHQTTPSAEGSSATPEVASAPVLLPLQGNGAKVALDAPELTGVELRAPTGVTKPTAIVVVLGGTRDALASNCDRWMTVAKDRFVLCLAEPEFEGESSARSSAVEGTLRQALRVTKRHFGAYVSAQQVTLVGDERTGSLVVELVRRAPAFFARMALVDGGFTEFSAVDSGRYGKVDQTRALLVCRSEPCELDARRVYATLRAAGVEARLLLERTREGGARNSFPDAFADELGWLVGEPQR